MSAGSCRVVRRPGQGRIWDVYCDDIGDYVATMNPTLPVSSREVAERICDSLNARRAARKAQEGSK